MKRLASLALALTASVAVALPAAASDFEPLVPQPPRDNPAVITTAGTYTQEAAEANAAAYRQAWDYGDQQRRFFEVFQQSHYELTGHLFAELAQRDVDAANALNAKQAIISDQRDQIFRQADRIRRQRAKIAELRQIIRDLRD